VRDILAEEDDSVYREGGINLAVVKGDETAPAL
jgi:hypothetical protein